MYTDRHCCICFIMRVLYHIHFKITKLYTLYVLNNWLLSYYSYSYLMRQNGTLTESTRSPILLPFVLTYTCVNGNHVTIKACASGAIYYNTSQLRVASVNWRAVWLDRLKEDYAVVNIGKIRFIHNIRNIFCIFCTFKNNPLLSIRNRFLIYSHKSPVNFHSAPRSMYAKKKTPEKINYINTLVQNDPLLT